VRDFLDEVQVIRAGIIEHNIVSDFMKVMQKKRINDEIIDTIIIVEHPEIVTIGAKSRREEVEISSDYKKVDVDRGGGITWHGPGQLVVYPIIKWGTKEQSIRKIIGKFEQLVINSLLDCGLIACRNPEMMGVWIDGKKICSIGLAFLQWVSRHGLAINYATPGSRIEDLLCCGLEKGTTTSLDKLGHTHDKEGHKIDRLRLEDAIISNIEKTLKRKVKEILPWNIDQKI
jgi:lipoyl(octanoyl) transferase